MLTRQGLTWNDHICIELQVSLPVDPCTYQVEAHHVVKMYTHPHVLHVGGAAEALIEQYNDQLREIRERGLADTDAAEPLRELLRALRDQPRVTEGSVKVCGASSRLICGLWSLF